jgi:hypothetical protein
MKVLWLAIDRSYRVARIFEPLQEEFKKLATVKLVRRNLSMLPRQWQKQYRVFPTPTILEDYDYVNSTYDFVMVDAPFAYEWEKWNEIKVKKGVLFEDQHGFNSKYIRRYDSYGFDVFFTRYNNITENYKFLKNRLVQWLPHSIDPDLMNDYKEPKNIMALMTGTTHAKIYPLRDKIHEQMKGRPFYVRIPRPVESMNPNEKKYPSGKDYAMLLNRSEISFTCMSVYKYSLMKYFEIPACRSVLFAEYDEQIKELGFEPGYNMVEINGRSDIVGKVLRFMNDENRLRKIQARGYKLVHTKHTAKVRAKELLTFLEGIL